jgi:hypothetical protein
MHGFGVPPAHLKAVGHRFHADAVAVKTVLNALLHLLAPVCGVLAIVVWHGVFLS